MTSREILERLFGGYVASKCYGFNYQQDDKDYETIKKDLEELEERRQIDEEILTMDIRHLNKAIDLTNFIRDLVILGIFKEKMINFARLKYAIYERKGLRFYNKFAMNDKLTKEEYRLIKEWLNEGISKNK